MTPLFFNGKFCRVLKLGLMIGLVYSQSVEAGTDKYAFDHPLNGPASRYTRWVIEALRHWPPVVLPFEPPKKGSRQNPVELIALETKGNPNAIAVAQRQVIHASLKEVEANLDDADHYAELFPGYKEVKVMQRDDNLWQIYWEQRIPIFFIPNVKYTLNYLLMKADPNRKIYRYQLKESNKTLTMSDGCIVIEKRSANETLYTEVDLFDANWGLASSLGAQKLWQDALEGIYVSDLALKLKSENPSWTRTHARDEAAAVLKKFPVDAVYQKRIPLKLDWP